MARLTDYFLSVIEGSRQSLDARFLRGVLRGGSLFYGAGSAMTRALYESGSFPKKRLSVPVVSVGNLTWGGTGKTPFVAELVKRVLAAGKMPLVLIRGYGNDESKMLRENFPSIRVGVGRDRARVAERFLRDSKIDLVICDDAFQHWRLARDWDIVMMNGRSPEGNGFLIPRGSLREPVSALRRAHSVVLTHTEGMNPSEIGRLWERIRSISPGIDCIEAAHRPLCFCRPFTGETRLPESFRGVRAAVLSGIGFPVSFRKTLGEVGIETVKFFEFPDHHHFRKTELFEIRDFLGRSGVTELITTEKDFFRASESFRGILNPWVLKMELRIIQGGERLAERLAGLLEGKRLTNPGAVT
ncbi:MAG TPA: tetraacyldisaccharide 4'-kinase [Candidatus Omnitrophota bacterium]|nr:tetraacyldisaccharide 4'-kinase [Candidatus Omnitrophota bacterium]